MPIAWLLIYYDGGPVKQFMRFNKKKKNLKTEVELRYALSELERVGLCTHCATANTKLHLHFQNFIPNFIFGGDGFKKKNVVI